MCLLIFYMLFLLPVFRFLLCYCFVFLNVVPVFRFSVCTADQVTLFSFHFLIWPLPPSSDWVWFGGVPTPRIRHLWLVAGHFRDTPQPIALPHPPMPMLLKYASNSPQLSLVTTLPWRTPDLVCPRAVCGRPKWRSKAPAQTLPLKTWKICRPWTPSAPEASVCPSMRCAGRAFLVTSATDLYPYFSFSVCRDGGRGLGIGGGRCGVGVDIWFGLILIGQERVHAGGGFRLFLSCHWW